MRIEMKCGCGASAVFDSGAFINGGGAPDGEGRVYLVEARAAEWQQQHAEHAARPKYPAFSADEVWDLTHPRRP